MQFFLEIEELRKKPITLKQETFLKNFKTLTKIDYKKKDNIYF